MYVITYSNLARETNGIQILIARHIHWTMYDTIHRVSAVGIHTRECTTFPFFRFDPFGEQVRNKNKASLYHHTTCLQLAILLDSEWFDF
jgi:hypothetical protein